ncbi:THUMP domain-containing class I SAM-dependent RNA methyltransferase [Bordetella avium]|uniref:THUMP domain-containing class I SAM-dependent RNA methyltransferase n=1 Tax=Bordetella avium TaxID=521 RepID=UPI000E68CE07|nr:class I SAM-dependent RNA methyltransferase [Bordetella avium]AZY52047.1 RNA methyltransferase [Bordetella avium]RIQ16951.1 class I SAM-dependent RNA methyltransferase [Bordetella avium]RIQ36323.1 class I SAM-dependent RNA methyltransferase [Bordetella avium]
MSQDENDRPRKTLTIKAKPSPDGDDAPLRRKRSGARARQAAQIERAHYTRAESPPAREPEAASGYAERPAQRSRPQPYAAASRGTRSRGDDQAGENRRRSGMGVVRADTPAPDWDDVFAGDAQGPGLTEDSPVEVDSPQAYRRRRHSGRQAEIFRCYAPCPQGLEDALTAEMQALGFDDAQAGRAGCGFTSDWSGIQRANLYSRLAARILVQVGAGNLNHEDELLDLAYSVPWENWFGPEDTLRVDTSAIKSPVHSLQYCNLRVKDGICDRLRDREGARPSIDTVRPDARVQLFMEGTHATLYLDTSGESLFKRGWRLDKGEAPLRENLAAGMLALAGWDPSAPLLDPFCGSGTILIEAAWIALGVPPGISRPFGFERMRQHDARRWRDLKDDARSRIRTQLETPLIGYDIDERAIEFARANAERAWLTEETIRFEVGDARHVKAPASQGWIVTNPPYGERMEIADDFWREWSACLKHEFAGWQAHIISSDMKLPQRMRLKPVRRIPLHNGSLDCRLFAFELVQAGYRDGPSGLL